MPPVRLRLLSLITAALLVLGVPATAQGVVEDHCETVEPTADLIVQPLRGVGHVTVCDEDHDGIKDTLRFETGEAPSDGEVSVTSEEKRRSNHRDDNTKAKVRISPYGPSSPTLYNEVLIQDDDDNGNFDVVGTEGGLYTHGGNTEYFLSLRDYDDDGNYDAYGLLVCSPTGFCEAPGVGDVPDVPDRVDLPDLVFRIEPIGWVP